ncbi:MAG: GGDEF domain-containing protein [Gammaproteobacteria bacterium]|jgi:diguanylate cyclase|nr:GGDEF domain-containing protein [Gammaproteobacteria bacterium]
MAVQQDTSTQQKARVYRVATLGAGIFVHLIVCWTVLSIGSMSITALEFLALASLSAAGFLLIALLIGIEWNLTLEDPDMAVPQMIWALTVVIITSHYALELKPVVLLSGLAMIVMGANRLTRSQQIFVATYGLLIYMLSVFFLTTIDSLGWVTEMVLMIAFGLVLGFGPALYQFERNIIENLITDKNEELGRALEQIKELAIRDELTGVFNRRHMLEVLDHEKALADRKNYDFSVCYVDLDYFKKVNDKFGHATGDSVLKNFSRVAEQVTREVDCVARIGGEEFILVLSGTNETDAVTVARRLAEGLRDMHVSRIEPRYRISASIGIAEYRSSESIQQLLDRADRAMYDSKRNGRNRIVVAGESGAEPGFVNNGAV